jgi:hypothetical protein
MNKPLIVVLGHGQASHVISMMTPFWMRHNADIIMVTPQHDAIICEGSLETFAQGQSTHHGPDNIARLRRAVNLLMERKWAYSSLWVFEYDSMCLTAELPMIEPNEIAGTWFYDPDNAQFEGKQFSHFPIGIGGAALKYLHAAMQELGDDRESGYPDRYMGLAAKRAMDMAPFAIKLRQLNSYSKNTIEPRHHEEMIGAITGGATFIHGVKDAKTLALAIDAYVEGVVDRTAETFLGKQ